MASQEAKTNHVKICKTQGVLVTVKPLVISQLAPGAKAANHRLTSIGSLAADTNVILRTRILRKRHSIHLITIKAKSRTDTEREAQTLY